MVGKVGQVFVKALLLLVVILVAWIALNQIESEPLAEVAALTSSDTDFSNQKPQWDNELFKFIQNFDQDQKPIAPDTLKKYRELLVANKDFPAIPPLLSVNSFFSRRFALDLEVKKQLDQMNFEDQLAYLEATLKFSQNILKQQVYFIIFGMEISLVSSSAKYIGENKGRYLILSSSSARDRFQNIEIILREMSEQRMSLIQNALEGERKVQLAMSKEFKLSDLALAEQKNKLSLTVWDQIGFLFYNQGATQNTIYENFESLKEASKCIADFSCEKLCSTDACPEVPRKITGSLFLNPTGMYFSKFMRLEPRLLVKISSRFREIKAVADNLKPSNAASASQ